MNKISSQILAITALLLVFIFAARADQLNLDYPHNSTNTINCWSCHYYTNNPADWATHEAQDIDDTPWNTLCWDCHNDTDADYVKTHSSLAATKTYGTWTIECKTCHWAHHQSQLRTYGAESYLYTATTDQASTTTLTRSGGAAWTEDQYAGYLVIPNISQRSYNYKILGNTADTLTVEGPIDTAKLTEGSSTLAIIYGKLIRSTIATPYRVVNQNSYLYTAITAAAEGNVLTMSGGAAWQVNEYKNYIVLPNINKPNYEYLIVGNTEDSLTVRGDIDLSKVTPTEDTLAIYRAVNSKKTVKLFDSTGANSFADGDATYDGVCEVCHSQTAHFRNNGAGVDQLHDNWLSGAQGTDCIRCHNHVGDPADGSAGFGHAGLIPTDGCIACHGHDSGINYDPDMALAYESGPYTSTGKGSYKSHSTHTETDSDDAKGPAIYCTTCHNTAKFPYFSSGTDSDGDGRISLAETDVCDTCHSPNGSYDGVDNSTYGAKANWTNGVYLADGVTLQGGKDKWCASCHDEDPSVISSISAPNVIGDEDGAYSYGTGWGYYKTGHGLAGGAYPASVEPAANQECSGCHDYSTAHIDGAHRTYLAASDNYQAGYRLKDIDSGPPMDIPRTDFNMPVSDFALCFDCHDSDPFLVAANPATNFRNAVNGHEEHLTGGGSWTNRWDSDWDGASGDSMPSCPACHNVHGSPSPRMVRYGQLISTPGTTDKVPAMGLEYLPAGATLPNSTSGKTYFHGSGGGTIAKSGICVMCHNDSYTYNRTPSDVDPPEITSVIGSVGSADLLVTFSEAVYSSYTDTAFGDLVAGDFEFVDADDSRTITGVSHTAGNDYATLSLSSALDASNDLGVDTLAAADPASYSTIYDQAGNQMSTDTVMVASDTDPPTAADLSPANSDTEIVTNSDLTFTLADSGSGVDWTTFSISLSGSRGYSQTYTDADTGVVSKTGTVASYVVTVDPDTDFDHDETITMTVNVDDNSGNPLAPPTWSFSTLSGGGPFSKTLHPSGVVADASFSITSAWATDLDSNDSDTTIAKRCCGPAGATLIMAMDDPTGLETATIQSITFHIYAKYNTSNTNSTPWADEVDIGYKTGTNTTWRGDFTTDTSGDYNLISSATYTTDSDGGALDLADINNLQISVKRNNDGTAPELRVTEIYAVIAYGVAEGDSTPPFVSNMNPANSATEVGLDADLIFTLADNGGGVYSPSFSVSMSGNKGYAQTYTDEDAEVTFAGSPASYTVTVATSSNYALTETVTVTVNADDTSSNSMTPPSWSFTSAATSTPQTTYIYPSGMNAATTGTWGITGDWASGLDANDGDTSYASICCTAANRVLQLDMDDPAGLGGATIQDVTIHVYARGVSTGPGPPPGATTLDIGYKTGTAIVWRGSYTTDFTGDYNFVSSSTYTTDSDGGALDLTDLNNLRATVKWASGRLRVTQVYVEITYLP